MTTTTLVDVSVDGWLCTCGNTADSDGFYPSVHGVVVEPVKDGPWDGREYLCERCGRIFDQSTGVRIVSDREIRDEAESALLDTITDRCWCEHGDHAPDHWCHNEATDGAVADWVGNVCRQCADGHYAPYIIWPEALPAGQSVHTVTTEYLAAIRAFLPRLIIPSREAYEGHHYVPLAHDLASVLRNELGL